MDIVKTFFKAECGCEVWVFFYGPPRWWTQVQVFFAGSFKGANGIDNRFGGKLVWKELPQHCALYWGLMGVLQNCKPWMVTSSHRMLILWCLLRQETEIYGNLFFSFASIAASHGQELGYGDISDEALWVGQLGNMGGWCSGIFENCLMPHIVLEARLGERCLNAKPDFVSRSTDL